MLTEHSESELIERARSDPEAFGELYRRNVDLIYNYIYHRVGNVADTEDLTARVFQRAMKNVGQYVDRGLPFGAWLYRIAHNLTANWHRDTSRRVIVSLDAEDAAVESAVATDDGGDQLAARLMADARVTAAIRGLEPDRQDLLILKFAHGLTNAEIAAVMGRTEGAVKSLYHRTLLVLREQLGDSETEPSGDDWMADMRDSADNGNEG